MGVGEATMEVLQHFVDLKRILSLCKPNVRACMYVVWFLFAQNNLIIVHIHKLQISGLGHNA